MVGARLVRHLGVATRLSKGEWSDRTASGRPAVCCPDCGEIAEIEYPNEVSNDGRVRFRWACPSERCGFIDFLYLEAYREEVLS